jgi:NAD(P)-dependent dehydrogenase (short-subunit alcohol dehydrogenase family)
VRGVASLGLLLVAPLVVCERMSILVIGGAGALGRSILSYFSSRGATLVCADVAPCPALPSVRAAPLPAQPWAAQLAALEPQLAALGSPFRAVLVVAGGWEGGGAGAPSFPASVAAMEARNLHPALLAAAAAARGHLAPGGLLALTGSAAALGAPAPGMLAYYLAKRATHDLARALGARGGGLPAGAAALAVAPAVIDTPANRRDMPGADAGAWTPPEHIAAKLWEWTEGAAAARPASGSVVEARTAAGATTWHLA